MKENKLRETIRKLIPFASERVMNNRDIGKIIKAVRDYDKKSKSRNVFFSYNYREGSHYQTTWGTGYAVMEVTEGKVTLKNFERICKGIKNATNYNAIVITNWIVMEE